MRARPNIILVTTDQQRTDSLSCYGSRFTSTPALDRLAQQGALCDRAYCTNPVCTPSRFSIFTGLHVRRHGAWNVGLSADQTIPTLAHRLGDAGYRTHYVGKIHFQAFGGTPAQSRESVWRWAEIYPSFSGPYYGFQTIEIALGHATFGLAGHYGHWVRQQVSEAEFVRYAKAQRRSAVSFGGEAFDWSLPTRLHNSVWTADRVIDFLERHDRSQPFLLAVGFEDPHHPHCVPTDIDLRVRPEDVPPPDWTEGELDDQPAHFRLAREGRLDPSPWRGAFPVAGQGEGFDFRPITDADARLGRAYYHTLVCLIDREMGRILDALDRIGLADDTLLIFTSDHGELLGDHGLWMKGPFLYEPLIRVPLIVRWPRGGVAGGRRIGAVTSLVDLTTTCLAAAAVDAPPGLDGLDMLPLLRGQMAQLRDHVLLECIDDLAPGKLRLQTIVTADHKLTRYEGHDFGELYDLRADPREKINLWSSSACSSLRASLLRTLRRDLSSLPEGLMADRYCYA